MMYRYCEFIYYIAMIKASPEIESQLDQQVVYKLYITIEIYCVIHILWYNIIDNIVMQGIVL